MTKLPKYYSFLQCTLTYNCDYLTIKKTEYGETTVEIRDCAAAVKIVRMPGVTRPFSNTSSQSC